MTDHADPQRTPLPPKPVDLDLIEAGMRQVLLGLGQEDKAEVMRNTPRRVAELYQETINASFVDIEDVFKTFPNPGMADDPVIVNDVHYVSMCEHHLAPAFGVAHVAYVPNEKVVGYSKLKKGLNYIARQPQLNERILTTTLDALEAQLEPKGVALVLQSVHCCIANRANAPMQEIVTVAGWRGCYTEGPLRSEFWSTTLARKPLFLGG